MLRHLAILDTETTSLDPAAGHVVEGALALWSLEHRALVRARSWLVKAPLDAVAATQHVHGIPPALVEARGVPFDAVCKQVLDIASREADCFVAHHSAFDRAWFPLDVQNVAPWVCSCDDIAWPRPSTSRSLTAIALAHGVGVTRAHRALDDVLTLAALFDRVAESHDVEAMLVRAMRPKAIYEVADRTFSEERNALAKSAGFRWDAPTKSWRKSMAREDAGALPFAVKEVS